MEYRIPPVELLLDNHESSVFRNQAYVKEQANKLDTMFRDFKMDVQVVEYHFNDFAILLKVKPGPNVSIGAIRKLRKDIELCMGNPIDFLEEPKKNSITIAVKSFRRPHVAFKDVLLSTEFQKATSEVAVAAGIDLFGGKCIIDLARISNLLVAGTTGSGKSVFLHDIIMSIIYHAHPDHVKLLLMDMKGIEFPLLNGIPHMLQDAITDIDTGMAVLEWLRNEKDERLLQMARAGVDNIVDYNLKAEEPLPRIVLIIDEYMEFVYDWGSSTQSELYNPFTAMLTELVRASEKTGIHLVLATQRPSDDRVVTRDIKSLIPARVAFYVVDKRESRIVLERTGAERLMGCGDMIFTENDIREGVHAQAAYLTDDEINQVAAFLRRDGTI